MSIDLFSHRLETGLLTYGELLPAGVNKLFGCDLLDASNASIVLDLGMGTGKVLMQAFLGSWTNLKTMVGVELAKSRYLLGEAAMRRLVNHHFGEYRIIFEECGVRMKVSLSAH